VGSNVYVAWTADTFALFRASTDNGAHFGPIKKFDGGEPRIDSISDTVYLIWSSDGNTIFSASTDNGAHFGNAKKISQAQGITDPQQISSSGNAVRIVLVNDPQLPGEKSDILFRASGNEGDSFGSIKNLSNNDGESENPQIISSGGNIYVVWQDDTPGNFDIFFKKGVD